MNSNVIPLRRNTIVGKPTIGEISPPDGQQPIGISQSHDAPMSITIPTALAQSIRVSAGMHCKDPQEFVLNWLKSGFYEEVA